MVEYVAPTLELELPGGEVITSRGGDKPTAEPERKIGLAALLDLWDTLDEDLPEIEDPPLLPEDVF